MPISESREDLLLRIGELTLRLEEARETLEAIRTGGVDALVVKTPGEQERVYTLEGAERAYRVLLEALNEGACTIAADGTILYANCRFADLMRTPLDRVLGSPFCRFVATTHLPLFRALLEDGLQGHSRATLTLHRADAYPIDVMLSLRMVEAGDTCAAVVTDLTELRQVQEALCRANEELEGRVVERTAELSAAVEQLQVQREELEVTNEELAAAYEEVQTANEELRVEMDERRAVEGALRQSEERYRILVENSPFGILLTRPDTGEVLAANPAACRMFGMSQEELLHAGRSGIVDLRDPRLAAALEERDRTGVARGELTLVRKDGARFEAEVSSTVFAGPGGKLTASMIISDISDRKQAEERTAGLQAVTAALSGALTPADVAQRVVGEGLRAIGAAAGSLAVVSEDGRELVILGSVGYSQEALAVWGRFPVDAPAPIADAVRTGADVLLPDEAAWDRAYPEGASANRTLGYGAGAAIPLRLDGRVLGGMGLSFAGARTFSEEDVAFMRAIAGQAAQALERARLYEAAEKARAEAEEANRAKGQFVALVSHELRNPLNAITTGVHLLRQSLAAEGRAARALEIVERNAALQARLVNDLLDLSRLQQGRLQLQRAPTRLDKLVLSAAQGCEDAAKEAGLSLTYQAEPDLWVQGDADRLQQVVMNLLTNAAKFTPAPGEIRVGVWECECVGEDGGPEAGDRGRAVSAVPGPPSSVRRCARVVVEDTGIGISPELLPTLFDMFRQGEIGGRRSAGLGLGLALVQGIVERHGGRAWAESEGVGKGSRFIMELPLIEAPTTTPSSPRPLGPSQIRVLVVEDNADTRTTIADSLTLAGYQVQAAGSGEEALEVLQETGEGEPETGETAPVLPHIMLVDIGLPGINGFEFLLRAREVPGMEGVPAFAVTGWGAEEDVRVAREAGFAGHFVKPVDVRSLDQRIRECLGAPTT